MQNGNGSLVGTAAMNILLIQLKRFGDLVLTTPAISAIKESYPRCQDLPRCARANRSLASRCCRGVDVLLMPRRRRDVGRLTSIALAKLRLFVDFTRNNRSALSHSSPAHHESISYGSSERRDSVTRLQRIITSHRVRDMHTVDHNLSLLEPLGINPRPPPPVSLSPGSGRAMRPSASGRKRMCGTVSRRCTPGRLGRRNSGNHHAGRKSSPMRSRKNGCVLTGGASRIEQTHLAEIMRDSAPPVVRSLRTIASAESRRSHRAAVCFSRRLSADASARRIRDSAGRPFRPNQSFHWRPRDSAGDHSPGDANAAGARFRAQTVACP